MYRDALTYSPFAQDLARRRNNGNVTEIQPDMESRHLINRIKTSRAPRQERDNLCGMLRWQAVDGCLDQDAVARILQMLALFEKTSAQRKGQQDYDIPPELTVDQEIQAIADERDQRQSQNQLLEHAFTVARSFQTLRAKQPAKNTNEPDNTDG